MKKKYGNYYDVNDVSINYGQYIYIKEYMTEYYSWTETKPSETEEERLAHQKAEKRNEKIDQILG